MSSLTPSGGRPDHEEPNYPHGAALATASGVSVNGTTVLAGVNVESVGAYRSIVIQVKNNGTRDLTFTPEWDFYNGAAHIRSTDSQVVPAGTSRRLIFQNQGDLLNKVTVTGGGAGDTINHYIAPSNLDPLAKSAPDFLLLQGTTKGVTNPAIGDNDHAKFQVANAQTNDASLWTYVLDAGGLIKEIDVSATGRYQLFAQGKWAPDAAVYQKTMVLDTFGTGGYGVSPAVSTVSATQEEMFVGAFDFVTGGTMQIDVNVAVSVAGPINFICVYLWILRWAI